MLMYFLSAFYIYKPNFLCRITFKVFMEILWRRTQFWLTNGCIDKLVNRWCRPASPETAGEDASISHNVFNTLQWIHMNLLNVKLSFTFLGGLLEIKLRHVSFLWKYDRRSGIKSKADRRCYSYNKGIFF